MDSNREKYNQRVKQEEEQSRKNREKRIKKKKSQELEQKIYLDNLKEHSSGFITWKQSKNSYIWDGYISEQKVFKINKGMFKYSLSIYPGVEVGDKKDKNIKTSFEIGKLELLAEEIAKRFPPKQSEPKKGI